MRIRYITAWLLAVLLFGGSTLASACDLSCQAHAAMSVCHQSFAEHAAMSAAAMPDSAMSMACGHCRHVSMVKAPDHQVSSTCEATECGHSVQPATSRAGESAFTVLWSPVLVAAEIVLADPPVHRGDDLRMAVPRGDPGFDPLLVSLRV
ncbi:hypothetical protein [Granulicella arctica]|uniref:Putative CHY-type Zn-finger protein n=1 Tax=Granulicella arctica TaxID=940613 RepID=A0A7Y9PHS5_9BACT|nr:hypothetical protein [Granulicella arctica]NYF80149.1 putative CHY-type Zn-finger protein [Granulicella arctica]